MSTAEQQRQRVTVISPFGQHQVDLPTHVPVSGFLPDLLVMAGLHPSPSALGGTGWQLEDAHGTILAADSTLAAHGIRPGGVIRLLGAPSDGSGPAVPNGVAAAPPAQKPSSPTGTAAPPAGRARVGHGAIFARDKVQLSRHVPRGAAPADQRDDSSTPLERAAELIPNAVGRGSRFAATLGAFFRDTGQHSARRGAAQRPDGARAEVRTATNPEQRVFVAGTSGTAVDAPDMADDTGLATDEQPATADEQPTPRQQLDAFLSGARLMPSELTLAAAPSRLERARARWRDTDHLGQLDSLITEPRLLHCATIAVVSPKGGVGKTTVTALLGTLFSLLRRDPIVAVDTNPDFGSLGRVLTPDQSWYVDDLARLVNEDDELSLTALDSHLGRAVHGLLVVPAPTDPARMAALDEEAYGRVITRLKDFFSLILLDCGTGLQDPASLAAIAAADQVVVLTDAQPATASLVAESTELLHQWGRPLTVVVNRMPAKAARLDIKQLSRYLPAARGLVVIPDDVIAASRLAVGSFDWRDAPDSWQLALRRLAVVLVSDWRRLGLAR
jgi:MinD-like ATPase involved in chromosome partitioning or flagellar assembly